MTLGQKQFYIDNICDTNNDKKEIIDLTGFESNFSSPFTYEYYDNQSDLWLGQNKIQNPTSYAYDGNSGNSTLDSKTRILNEENLYIHLHSFHWKNLQVIHQ